MWLPFEHHLLVSIYSTAGKNPRAQGKTWLCFHIFLSGELPHVLLPGSWLRTAFSASLWTSLITFELPATSLKLKICRRPLSATSASVNKSSLGEFSFPISSLSWTSVYFLQGCLHPVRSGQERKSLFPRITMWDSGVLCSFSIDRLFFHACFLFLNQDQVLRLYQELKNK